MKRFTTIALVALLAIAALVVPATALVETVEVRSQVYNGTNLSTIVDANGDLVFDETNFAGFWYDIDANKSSENLTILNSSLISGDSIEEKGLWYNSTIQQTEYEGSFAGEEGVAYPDNETFPVIGLFAEKYVPLDDADASELVKLLVDNDDKYTLRTGSALELANGYELTAKQIDVEGDKVWMELSKDGEFVEDEVVDVTNGEATWDYDTDVGDQTDVIVFRVKITDVFQGQVDSLAVVEGLWLIDYENILEVESSDEFGELEVNSATGNTISMFNSGTLTLSNDKTVDLAEGLMFKTADVASGDLRFALYKEYTDVGTYEVRGSVAYGNASETWTAAEFAGFWYDLDANKSSETLTIDPNNWNIAEKDLWYNSTIQQTEYEGSFAGEEGVAYPDNETFPVIGLFAEMYVPLDDADASELVKLLVDNDDKYTLRTGSALELANGYELTAKQIDVEGDKVWMELSKDGEFVEDEVVDVNNGEATWDYDTDVGDQTDVIVFRAKITDVFQGQVDSLAVVEGLWLIDYENILEVESSDEFGELEVNSASGLEISMFNSNSIGFGKDKTVTLAEGLMLKTADSDNGELRYYPFVERTIGEEVTVDDSGVGEVSDEEMPADEEVAGEETPVVDEEAPVEEETPVEEEEAPAEDTEESPGFEAVFAVAGLLAVAYLVRRN
ncbi:S-layer protein domain-containing protein [Methanolobus sediminis]|uniref:S-layer protein domain-containing protein n=1 Tax=Methanolobus sediminis TaxID=3072978 RepID=A0AA51YMM4_9EURY|nr:S-layer protein domain-containing protein [Methanolobus sediminis]WMW26174.1 S-layer protein domain-containing protein [Methanolobus sediminis]